MGLNKLVNLSIQKYLIQFTKGVRDSVSEFTWDYLSIAIVEFGKLVALGYLVILILVDF